MFYRFSLSALENMKRLKTNSFGEGKDTSRLNQQYRMVSAFIFTGAAVSREKEVPNPKQWAVVQDTDTTL